jgi:23S rRNA (cytidine1920-2'-O)/16S rRNA (cytidine1409-2'-O)-methyltransferase
LPHGATLTTTQTHIVPMFKRLFEPPASSHNNIGFIKHDRMRRDILKDFEAWARQHFVITDKADSDIAGSKGNVERFYKLQKL